MFLKPKVKVVGNPSVFIVYACILSAPIFMLGVPWLLSMILYRSVDFDADTSPEESSYECPTTASAPYRVLFARYLTEQNAGNHHRQATVAQIMETGKVIHEYRKSEKQRTMRLLVILAKDGFIVVSRSGNSAIDVSCFDRSNALSDDFDGSFQMAFDAMKDMYQFTGKEPSDFFVMVAFTFKPLR